MKKTIIGLMFVLTSMSALAQTKMPTREQLESAAPDKFGQVRFTLPTGDVKWKPISVFWQPVANSSEGKTLITTLKRATAEELSLVGESFDNEACKTGAFWSILTKDAILYYREIGGRMEILYLDGCKCEGKDTQNRIRLIVGPNTPSSFKLQQPTESSTSTPQQLSSLPPQVIEKLVEVEGKPEYSSEYTILYQQRNRPGRSLPVMNQ